MNVRSRNSVASALAFTSLLLLGGNAMATDRLALARQHHTLPLSTRITDAKSARSDVSLQQVIQKALLQPQPAGKGLVSLSNPSQRLHATLSTDGLMLRPGLGTHTAAIRLASLGCGGHTYALPAASPRIDGAQVNYSRGPVTEWYRNTARGIEQGFILAARPQKTASGVALHLDITGDVQTKLTPDGKAITLKGRGINLVYRDLAAWDAHHRTLPAHMEMQGRQVTLAVDDRNAAYPITIDPYAQQAELYGTDGLIVECNSVALQGNTAVLGDAVQGANAQGAVYVFGRVGSVWTQQAKLVAGPNYPGTDLFGSSVAINSTEDMIAVGSPNTLSGIPGRVYTFVRSGNSWNLRNTLIQGSNGDKFGSYIAIDGNNLAIWTLSNVNNGVSPGYVIVYTKNAAGGWDYQSSILPYTPSFGVYGPFALVNNTFAAFDTSEGAVAVRQWNGSKWNIVAGLLPHNLAFHDANNFPRDGFGESVAIDRVTGDIVVGAPYGTPNSAGNIVNNIGNAYVFNAVSGGYSRPHTLLVYDNLANDLFGYSVAAENGHVIVGSPHHVTGPGTSGGAANTGFVYNFTADKSSGIYSAYDELTGQPQQIQNVYNNGSAVAINGGTILSGAERAAYTYIPAYVPSTQPDAYSTAPNVPLTVDAAHGVLANDTNLGTGTMTVQLYSSPANGTLQLNADGSFTYTPNKNFAGTDTFQYDAVNKQGNSSHTTVTLQVTTPTSMYSLSVNCNEGQSCTLKAILSRGATFNPNQGIAGQTVTFLVSGNAVGTAVTSANGTATLQYKPTAIGNSVVTAQYAGSTNGFYAPSSVQSVLFVRALTMISMAALPTPVGAKIPTTCTIWRTADGVGVSGVAIHFTINKANVGTAVTDSNGIARINLPASAHVGTVNIVGQFIGDASFQASSGVVAAEIDAAPTMLSVTNASGTVGSTTTLKATLVRSADNGSVNGVTVTFLNNGATLGTATTVNGVATFNYTIPAAIPAGASTLTAQFAGNADYNASTSGNATLTVSTNTKITVTNLSAKAGATLMLSAQLLSTPGGASVTGETLTFAVNGKPAGLGKTDATGTATCSYHIANGTPAGSLTVTVTHMATNLYKASSGTGTITVH